MLIPNPNPNPTRFDPLGASIIYAVRTKPFVRLCHRPAGGVSAVGGRSGGTGRVRRSAARSGSVPHGRPSSVFAGPAGR